MVVQMFKRRKLGKTNYNKRLKLCKSGITRLVVRKTNTQVIAQLANFHKDGDIVLTTVNKFNLKKLGLKNFKNKKAAYIIGLLIGKKAKELGIKKCILDMGLHTPTKGNFAFYVANGASKFIDIKHPEVPELQFNDDEKKILKVVLNGMDSKN